MLHKIITTLMSCNTMNTEAAPSEYILKNIEAVKTLFQQVGAVCTVQKYSCIAKESGKKITHANLFVVPQNTTGPYIMFQGHIDTVPFSDTYEFTLTKTKLTGRGSVDMKGSLAGSIDAFLRLCKTRTWTVPPALLITGDEEANGFIGIKTFLNEPHPEILFCINGEPTNLRIGSHLCGVAGYRIIRAGKVGHSAFPDKKLLIEDSLPLLCGIKKFLQAARAVSEKKFGITRGALTIVRAGEKDNQLPGELLVSWNIRTVKAHAFYQKIFGRTIGPHLRAHDRQTIFCFDPCVASLAPEIRRTLRMALKEIHRSFIEKPVSFFTEATVLNEAHIPTIVCGPGDQTLAHVIPRNEKIPIKDIQTYSRFLVAFVTRYSLTEKIITSLSDIRA